jgi:hypothetical protein
VHSPKALLSAAAIPSAAFTFSKSEDFSTCGSFLVFSLQFSSQVNDRSPET